MSTTTPNSHVRRWGPLLNATSATAPSLTDPSLNAAFANQYVTVGTDQYFVDATGTAVKVAGGTATPTADIPAAIAIGTQAELDALTDKPAGGKYIVTDGANKGDVLTWADTDDDGVGDTWQVYLTPPALQNQDEWTVLTNATGEPAGIYTYDVATDTWFKIADVEPVIPPVDDETAIGGIKILPRRFTAQTNSGNIWIQGENVAGIGYSTGAGTDGWSATSSDTTGYKVRKAPISWHQVNSPFTQLINYRPYAVNAQQNQFGAVMLDHKGVLYVKGSNAGFNGTLLNLATDVGTPSFTPESVFAASADKIVDFWLAAGHTSLIVRTAEGKIYVKTRAGNINGDGTTTTVKTWHQVNVPAQGYKKLRIDYSGQGACVLSSSGDLYGWGLNTNNRFSTAVGTTAIVSTPILLLSNVKDFDMDNNSIMAILNDGSRMGVGANTGNGKLGNGTLTNLTTFTALPSNGFTFESVLSENDTGVMGSYFYITTDKKAVMTGAHNLQRGIAGAAAAGNVLLPTLMSTGAFQGYVVDIHPHRNSTLIHTELGELWSCVRVDTYGEHGTGSYPVAGVNIGFNVWRRVPVPGTVAKVITVSDVTNNVMGGVAQTTEGKLFHWSGFNSDIDGQSGYRYLPSELPTQMYRQDEPKASEVIDLYGDKLGTITGATLTSISSVVDGSGNQVVTAVISTTGTAGKIDLTGSTASGPDLTFNSWTTSIVGQTGTTGSITVQFVITADDIPTLNAPDTQPQNWTINLSANGSPVVITGTGTRITDAIVGKLSASLSAYNSATPGQAVQITAAEYANLMTISGAAKYGTTDATMATNPPNGSGGAPNATWTYPPTAFSGTYFASNQYLFAFSVKSKTAIGAGDNYQGLKIKWGNGSFTTGLTDHTTMVSSVPVQANTQKYFVVKGAGISPADAKFGIYQPASTTSDAIGGITGVTNGRYGATGDVSTGLTLGTVYQPVYIQGIMTPTKQW